MWGFQTACAPFRLPCELFKGHKRCRLDAATKSQYHQTVALSRENRELFNRRDRLK
ncbi:protein of unknown function (plasmid) [Azospirillum lipoferum 4B]|uniref:Uncharacterized protein n=1 Tax=Azospirillum lipoferum (strain 4B) TaxID=862719 RepID=G7ZG73_AZOL4|nr:protein of unknown function [Azospirillum lipoferum 4B]